MLCACFCATSRGKTGPALPRQNGRFSGLSAFTAHVERRFTPSICHTFCGRRHTGPNGGLFLYIPKGFFPYRTRDHPGNFPKAPDTSFSYMSDRQQPDGCVLEDAMSKDLSPSRHRRTNSTSTTAASKSTSKNGNIWTFPEEPLAWITRHPTGPCMPARG